MPRPRLVRSSLLALACGASAISCSDLSRFSTTAGESYCGIVTGGSFVRSPGLAEGTKMRLQLDTDAMQSQPGHLWTGELSPGERMQGAELRAIEQLEHDLLSDLTFGEGVVKSSVAVVELGHTEVVAVISLMQSGGVDVRLMRGDGRSVYADGTPKPPQIFGVFHLSKEAGDCGLP